MRMARASIVTSIGALLAACTSQAPAPPALGTADPMAAYVVHDTILAEVFPAYGTAQAIDRSVVATRLAGTVTAVLVREGDTVRAGQPLVRIDGSELDARAAQARASMVAARATYDDALVTSTRLRALYADSAAPRAQVDAAEAALARAGASVQAAQAAADEVEANRGYATLHATFGGVITARYVDPGTFAAPAAPLVMLENMARLRIVATTPGWVVGRLRRGMRIAATIEDMPATAVVEGVVPASGGGYTVNAVVDNARHAYITGGVAVLQIEGATRHALVVPRVALVKQGDLTGVHVRMASGPVLRWIEQRSVAPGVVEVLSGLRAGDTVLMLPASGERGS